MASLTRADIAGSVATLGVVAQTLTSADPASKAKLYEQLGIRLTYEPKPRQVLVDATVDIACTNGVVSEGGLEPPRPCGH